MPEIAWDILIQNLGWVLTLIAILTVGYKIGQWTKGIDGRLKKIEENPIIVASNKLSVKIISDILYEVFEKKWETNPLAPDEIRLRRELTEKLDAKTITPNEAKILHDILQKELVDAKAVGNLLAILAILFLIGLVIVVLSK